MVSNASLGVFAKLVEEEDRKQGPILDIGAKDGWMVSELGHRLDGESIAVDLEFKEITTNNAIFIQGNGLQLPFKDDKFEIVISNQTFEHISDTEEMISEISRVLTPDGIFIVSFPNRIWPFDGHGFPIGTPWLPRIIGKHLFSALDYRSQYYNTSMFPVTSIRIRHQLSRYFEEVEYRSEEFLNIEVDKDIKYHDLLQKSPFVANAFKSPGISFLTEILFPAPVYVGKRPEVE